MEEVKENKMKLMIIGLIGPAVPSCGELSWAAGTVCPPPPPPGQAVMCEAHENDEGQAHLCTDPQQWSPAHTALGDAL